MPKEPRQRQREVKPAGDTFTRNLVFGMVGLVVLSGTVFTFLSKKDAATPEIPVAIEQISAGNNGEPLTPLVTPESDYGIVFNNEAKPQIDIWEDFQCPFCGQFEKSMGSYLEQLTRSGEAKVVYHMVSFLGQESVRAANAAYCAVPEGRFIEFHKSLYAIQGAENSGLYVDKNLLEVGKRLGITSSEFEDCVTSMKNADNVKNVANSMSKYKVDSTPTVFINNKLWRPSTNTFNVDEFKAAVEAAR